ncbi:MAG: ABC transporter permease subunit [Acholeplasmatales bacterium]|nr:ABC transporter permease subunit [Acholeplasmatales bacterium]
MQKIVQTDQNVVDEVERTKWKRTFETFLKDWRLYVLLVPMLLFLILFKYWPIGSILQGFKWGDYSDTLYGDQWCGFYWLDYVFDGAVAPQFWSAFRNTFVNSMYGLIFGFPIPIFLALLFSEVKNQYYRSFLQVSCYLPHFVSTVVVTTIIRLWCNGEVASTGNAGGVLYQLFKALGWNKLDSGDKLTTDLLLHPKFFRPIYQVSGIWEGSGYGSIVYFAAILAISPTSYEAARIDGASKLQQIRYVTFPGMAPTLTIMLITRIGHILNIGYEKIILLVEDKESSWETADVISTYVYRMSGRSSLTTITPVAQVGIAMDLFNSLIAMALVLGANAISRRVSSTSLF